MTTRILDKPPAGLPLMVKAALPALPVIGGLPGIKHTGKDAPSLTLVRRGIRTDREHLAAYNDVCGFATSNYLPPTYPHMAAFGLHMLMMTDVSFPFVPMGLVHLRNSITQHRRIGIDEVFDVEVKAKDLRPHAKGSLIDIVTTATVDGDVVWEETMTLFSRHKGGKPEATPAPLEDVQAPDGVVHWKLEGNLGRRYGAISGDRNPIHLHPLTAKAFGFGSNIAHGMWTLARSLATVDNRLPEAFVNHAEFRKPILLPTTVVFGQDERDGQLVFGVKGSRKPSTHLVGTVAAL